VVGFLSNVSPEGFGERLRGFRQGLRDGGYVEGENVAIDEYRWAENQNDRLQGSLEQTCRKHVGIRLIFLVNLL
jgi:putative ABC transport system substrate-binding protein